MTTPHIGTGLRVAAVMTLLALMSTTPGSVVAAPAGPPAIGITATATSTGPFHLFMDLGYQIDVTNPSSVSYSSVTVLGVGASDAPPGPTPNATIGPLEIVGNGDDILDPAEQWRYSASGLLVVGSREFVVEALAPGGATVTNTAIVTLPATSQPLAIAVTPDQNPASPGSDVIWSVTAELVAPYSLRDLTTTARERNPDTAVPGPELTLDAPTVTGGNADGTFDQGEVWVWQITLPFTASPTSLEVDIRHVRALDGFEQSFFASAGQSASVVATVPLAPTGPVPPTDPGVLPRTGVKQTLAWQATLFLALGGLMIVASRKPRHPTLR